jgi:hypothetical protein
MSKEFTQLCEQNGIALQLTIMDTIHQNEIVERKNRTILDKEKKMSLNNNAPPYLWTKSVNTTIYFINISPSRSIGGHIPKEIYIGKKPKVHNLKVYGCLVYVFTPKAQRNKLEGCTKKCMFIGNNV